jgi:hypothetical protein
MIVVISQNVESVVELLSFLKKPSNQLPEAIELPGMLLVLSNRRDVYYSTTANSCSCPSAVYRPGQRCKHQRKYFPEPKKSPAEIEKETDEELARLHKAKWVGGFNGPLEPSEIADWAASTAGSVQNPRVSTTVSSLMLIDAYAPITTEKEIRYWEKKSKQDQEA